MSFNNVLRYRNQRRKQYGEGIKIIAPAATSAMVFRRFFRRGLEIIRNT
jgi:hypothetical protein